VAWCRCRIKKALVLLCAAAFVASCTHSSPDDGNVNYSPSTSTANPDDSLIAVHNPADLAFVRDMLTHHRQARDLMASAGENTTNSDVLASAQQLTTAQQTENQALTAWLMQWGDDPYDYDGMDTLTPGMVNQATMNRLRSLQGLEFDRLWLQSVLAYHQGAMEMAQSEVAMGQNPDAVAMANSILSTRPSEIDRIRKLLGD
jgi:uncharacterized protein (DUF305 family)